MAFPCPRPPGGSQTKGRRLAAGRALRTRLMRGLPVTEHDPEAATEEEARAVWGDGHAPSQLPLASW